MVVPQLGQSREEGIAAGGTNGVGAEVAEATTAGATGSLGSVMGVEVAAKGVVMVSETVLEVVEAPEDSYDDTGATAITSGVRLRDIRYNNPPSKAAPSKIRGSQGKLAKAPVLVGLVGLVGLAVSVSLGPILPVVGPAGASDGRSEVGVVVLSPDTAEVASALWVSSGRGLVEAVP